MVQHFANLKPPPRRPGRIRRWLYVAVALVVGMMIGAWVTDVALPKVSYQVQEQGR
jgi:uncharacterized membrane-anchored protein YhcB (DUF1043 family)